jgi:hypothetical protein
LLASSARCSTGSSGDDPEFCRPGLRPSQARPDDRALSGRRRRGQVGASLAAHNFGPGRPVARVPARGDAWWLGSREPPCPRPPLRAPVPRRARAPSAAARSPVNVVTRSIAPIRAPTGPPSAGAGSGCGARAACAATPGPTRTPTSRRTAAAGVGRAGAGGGANANTGYASCAVTRAPALVSQTAAGARGTGRRNARATAPTSGG